MKDRWSLATTPKELLMIANQLFILRSHGVEGCVLECGCFKGYSSCCLSISCHRLGYPLVIADSFAGLPPGPETVGEGRYYQVGDFTGSRAEVEQNLQTFGDPAGVEFVEGWYSDTLKCWDRPLALLWMDVDLDSSVRDVLNPCLPHLDPRSVIFSHEFMERSVEGSKIVAEHGVAGTIAQVVRENDPDYSAAYITGYLGIVGRRTSIGLHSYKLVDEITRVVLRRLPGHLLHRILRKGVRVAGIGG
jgi:hypothetical protein